MMVRLFGLGWVLLLSGLAACSEPQDRVTGSTSDGQFALRLEAEKNWLRAATNQTLPILVTLESLTGAFDEERTERVEFHANNGDVSASSLPFTFTPRDELLGTPGDTAKSQWITFRTDDREVKSTQQGEVIALLEDDDLQVNFKIRFVDGEE